MFISMNNLQFFLMSEPSSVLDYIFQQSELKFALTFGATCNYCRQDVLDEAIVVRLVEMLRHSSSNLQRKAASILDFLTSIEGSVDMIISANIESGLDAVFQRKILSGMSPDSRKS